VAAPVQITLRRALSTAVIALLSLISRAALSERSDECDNCGNFLSGDVRVPASKAIILYVCGSSGGFFDSNALAASSVRAHLDIDRRRAYGIVGVDELQLAVSERSGESSAESEGGIVSMRGRSISMRWGSSEMVRLSDGGSRLIKPRSLREGMTSDVVLVGGVNGTRNVPAAHVTFPHTTRSCFVYFSPIPLLLKISHSFRSYRVLWTFLVNFPLANPSGHFVNISPFLNLTNW